MDILDDNLGNPYTEEELADGEAEYEIPEGEHPVHGIQNLVWKDGSAVKLESWKQIVINDFEEGIDQRYGVWTGRYRVYESSGDRHKLYSTDEKGMSLHGGFIEINAQTAEIEDNFRNRPAAVLKNAVKGIIPKSAVRKTTKLGSDEIAEGSRLVFKIERYNGSTWENANGIAYIQGNYDSRRTEKNADPNYSYIDDSIAVREYKYSENGRIKVEKQNLQNAENGRYIFPKIIFPNDEVYVNPENPTKGMLRIYELLDDSETTGDWGRLSRVDTEEANAETGSVLTNTFVNSNREALIEVEKEITGEENPDRNAVFSFELRQITESTANLSAADGALGTNVQYDVYTTDEFGEEQKVNTTRLSTGTDGIIKIKHSEFARLYVNDDTVWTVHELEPVGYSLSDMEVINNAVKLGDNLALMNAKAEVLPERIEADTEYPCFGVYDELKADNVKADVIYTDGSRVDALSENIALKELKIVRKDNFGNELPGYVKFVPDSLGVIKIPDKAVTENGTVDFETESYKYASVKLTVTYTKDGNTLEATIEKPLARAAVGSGWNNYKTYTGVRADVSTVKNSDGTYKVNNHENFRQQYIFANFYCDEFYDAVTGNKIAWTGPDGNRNIAGDTFEIPGFIKSGSGEYYIIRAIRANCFRDQLKLNIKGKKLAIPPTFMEFGKNSFYTSGDSVGMTGDLYILDTVRYIGQEAFMNTGFDGNIRLPENDSYTFVDKSTFRGNNFTGDLNIPENILRLEDNCFRDCKKFTGRLNLNSSLYALGIQSFYMSSLRGVLVIPETFTEIKREANKEANAFEYCYNIDTVIFDGNSFNVFADGKNFAALNPRKIEIGMTESSAADIIIRKPTKSNGDTVIISEVKTVYIGSCVSGIESDAFDGFTGCREIYIDSSLQGQIRNLNPNPNITYYVVSDWEHEVVLPDRGSVAPQLGTDWKPSVFEQYKKS